MRWSNFKTKFSYFIQVTEYIKLKSPNLRPKVDNNIDEYKVELPHFIARIPITEALSKVKEVKQEKEKHQRNTATLEMTLEERHIYVGSR